MDASGKLGGWGVRKDKQRPIRSVQDRDQIRQREIPRAAWPTSRCPQQVTSFGEALDVGLKLRTDRRPSGKKAQGNATSEKKTQRWLTRKRGARKDEQLPHSNWPNIGLLKGTEQRLRICRIIRKRELGDIK